MSYLYKQQARNKSSSQRRAQTNNYFSPYDKENLIYFRDTIKQFCPFQRFVDHRPNPHRPLLNPPTDDSYYNYPTERENYNPCYYDYRTRQLYPLLTKEDLKIYLKNNGKLYKHQRPCSACLKINNGNYGRNYYTVKQKRTFPFVNGNFIGTDFRISSARKTPYSIDIKKIRYKNRNPYNNYDTYNQYNNEYNRNERYNNEYNGNERYNNEYYGNERYNNKYYENEKYNNEKLDNEKYNNEKLDNENYNNEKEEIKEEKNYIDKKNLDADYYEFCPNVYGHHKTQILNNYKPYMIDQYDVLGH